MPATDDQDSQLAPPEEEPVEQPAEEPPAGPVTIADLSEVARSYGEVHALGPVTLTVDGACVALLGPNGSGKTTLIRILMGLLGPTSGTLTVLGQDVEPGARSIRQRIGYVPEGDAIFPGLSGIAAVAYAGRLMGMGATDAMQRSHQVLDHVRLGEERYRNAATYSTGMRQRLKIAQALVHDPELLILDEPTEGVDPRAREEILTVVSDLTREHGLRVLLSTHLLADVERLATHVVVLNRGLVAAHGSLEDLRSRTGRGHLVRVNGSVAALTERLDAAGARWEMVGSSVRVELDDPSEVLRHVADAGLVVRHLAPAQPGLDEAFEQAVGGA